MPRFITELKRTHTCGELTKADVGKEVVLFGWVQNRRDHGGAVFIDLRDREGLTQVVFEADVRPEVHELAGRAAPRVLRGRARQGASRAGRTRTRRSPPARSRCTPRDLEIFNRSETPPFQIEDDIDTGEEKRLAVPLPRPAARAAAEDAHHPRAGQPPHAQLLHRPAASSSSRRPSW